MERRALGWAAAGAVPLAALLLLAAARTATAQDADAAKPAPRAFAEQLGELAQRHPAESLLMAIIGVYLMTVIAGRRDNLRVATEVSDAIAGPDGILAQNFAAHGSAADRGHKDPLWWREGPSTFKLWATGRRFCTGTLITIETPAHHDVIRRIIGQSDPRIEIEVVMREGSMAPMVLAVGPPKHMKSMTKSNPDVKDFARRVDVAADRYPLWPSAGKGGAPELVAAAESAGLFHDLFGDARVQQLVGKDPHLAKHLRQIIFSTEGSLGRPDRKLWFCSALPPPGRAEELRGVVALAMLLTDIVGSYKLSTEAASKAGALRAKVVASRAEVDGGGGEGGSSGSKAQQERQQAAMQRRLEKLAEEREKARRQGPKALEKFEERLKKQQLKKQMKRATVKMG